MVSISIFDIALIVDLICDPLEISDLQVCCQVSRRWSIVFGPHRWKTLDLSSTTNLTRDQTNGIIKNASYTHSLTITWTHQNLLLKANFCRIQELTLRDEILWKGNQPCHHNSVLALIARNKNMRSLTVDVDRCNYLENTFAASIMHTVAQHPSLVTFVWNVPSEVFGDSFVRSLLEVCQPSIHRLDVRIRGHYGNISWYNHDDDNPSYTFRDMDVTTNSTNCTVTACNLDRPLLKDLGQFVLQSVRVPGQNWFPILRNCPYLEDVHLDTPQENDTDTLDALESCSQLVGIYFSGMNSTLDISTALQRFSGLRRLRLPDFLGHRSFHPIFSQLVRSSLRSLQLLHVPCITTQDILQVLATFPNLQDMTVHRSGIDVQDLAESPIWACSHSIEVLRINGICDRHWEWRLPSGHNFWRKQHISDWTLRQHAQNYVVALSRLFTSLRKNNPRLATIQLNCQYNIHELFVSGEEAVMYANKFGEGAEDRLPMTIKDLQSMGIDLQLTPESSYDEHDSSTEYETSTEHDSAQEYTMAKARNRHRSHTGKRSQVQRLFKK